MSSGYGGVGSAGRPAGGSAVGGPSRLATATTTGYTSPSTSGDIRTSGDYGSAGGAARTTYSPTGTTAPATSTYAGGRAATSYSTGSTTGGTTAGGYGSTTSYSSPTTAGATYGSSGGYGSTAAPSTGYGTAGGSGYGSGGGYGSAAPASTTTGYGSGSGGGYGTPAGPTSAYGAARTTTSAAPAPATSGYTGGTSYGSSGGGYGSSSGAAYSSTTSTAYKPATTTTTSSYGTSYGAAKPAAQSEKEWLLEPVTHEGVTYLVDRTTGAVYKDAREDEWPQLVGRLGRDGRVELTYRHSASDLFHSLDAYLKNNRVRFRELFNSFDTDGSGALEAREVRNLVKQLLPDVAEHELRYFWALMDTNGDGHVDQSEFLEAARSCLDAERAAKERDAQLRGALDTVARFMQRNTDEARALFMSLDSAGSGRLGPAEQLAFFKGVDRRLTAQQLRLLMMHVRDLYSAGGDGTVTFIDVLRAFKVVSITRSSASASGSSPRYGEAAGGAGGYGGGARASGGVVPREYEWKLKDVYDAQGRHYLMDEDTKVVFFEPARPTDWPRVYGRLDSRGQVVAMERKSEGGLFAALDAYLKSARVKFRDVFDRYARGVGYLEPGTSLYDLLQDVLPGQLTKGDLYYFQVMLDVDGDGRITYDEFLSVVKEGMEVERAASTGVPSSTQGVDMLSGWLAANPDEAKRLYASLDNPPKGYLRYPEIGTFLKSALPNIQGNDKRSIFTYLASMDVEQNGRVTFRDLMRFFRAASPPPSAQKYSGSSAGYGSAAASKPYSSTTATTTGQYGSSASSGASSTWRLEELKYRGERYLLDPATKKVYSDPDNSGWPEFVGTWDGYSVRITTQSTAVTFFTSLDKYLKDARVRLRELFDSYDRGRKGYLSVKELRDLVKSLMPDVQEGDLRYFQAMIDSNGDDKVEYQEFVSAAQACLADEAAATQGRGAPVEVREVLQKMSDHVRKNRGTVEDQFRRFDSNRNGQLEPREVAMLFRTIMPGLTPQQLRYIMAHIHTIDRNNDGLISLQELMIALRAVDVEGYSGRVQTNFMADKYGSSSSSTPKYGEDKYGSSAATSGARYGEDKYGGSSATAPAAAAGRAPADASVDWTLEYWDGAAPPPAVRGAAPKSYMLDRKSGIVYSDAPDWPVPEGVVGRDGRLQPKRELRPSELFAVLDRHLKATQTRLADLFARYDDDRDGELKLRELAAMLTDLRLPDITKADILYTQALMDTDGNGRISSQELLATAKSVAEAQRHMTAEGQGAFPEDVRDLLDRVSTYIQQNLSTTKRMWLEADDSGNGYLEPAELAAFMRRLVRGMTAREQHYLIMHLAGMDVTGMGTVSFQELCIALRAVPPRTPRGVIHTPGFGRSGRAGAAPAAVRPAASPEQERAGGYGDVAAPAKVVPPGGYTTNWTLKDFEYRGEYYLLDPTSGLLYHDARTSEWPSLVGKLEGSGGRAVGLGADAITKFFTGLDAYLKDAKVRFRDVFNSYDTSRRGALGPRELYTLIKDVNPSATAAQAKYFALVLDTDGDGRISESEILTAAKDILAKLRTGGVSGARTALLDPAAAPALDSVSEYLYRNTSRAYDSFRELDVRREGSLDYDQLPTLFRLFDRKLRSEEIRALATMVHLYDAGIDGKVTFQELLLALRAVDCRSSKGLHARGFGVAPPPAGAPRVSTGGAAQRPGEVSAMSSARARQLAEVPDVWELEAFRTSSSPSAPPSALRTSSSPYTHLHDPETHVLYTRPATSSEWPVPVGRVAAGRAMLYTEAADAIEFFRVLDQYLKDARVRFREVFAEFDRDRSGHLDSRELRQLIKALLPRATEVQLGYAQVMLDCGGDKVVLTPEEFLAAAKQCMDAETEAAGGALPAALKREMESVSLALTRDRRAVASAAARHAEDRLGAAMSPSAALRMLRELAPGLSTAALRTVAVLLRRADAEDTGVVSLRAVAQALHAVEVRTPDLTIRAGTWALRTTSAGSPRTSSTPAKREAIIRSLDLDSFEHERKSYLIDRRTGVVYESIAASRTDTAPPPWPRPLGTYDRLKRMLHLKPPSANQADLFTEIDAYLRKEQVRFRDLFRNYDRNGNGQLERNELGALVRDFLGAGKVTTADVSYFLAMLDLEGNNSISEEEFLAVAKDFVEVERLARAGVAEEEVFFALNELSRVLSDRPEPAYELFLTFDTDGDGKVDHRGFLDWARKLLPELRTREVHYLLTHLHGCDADKAGTFTFNELLVLFRAVPVRIPGGRRIPQGFSKIAKRDAAAGVLKPSPAYAATKGGASERALIELKDVRLNAPPPTSSAAAAAATGVAPASALRSAATAALADPVTGFVYAKPQVAGEYPAIIGKLDGQLPTTPTSSGSYAYPGTTSASVPTVGLVPPLFNVDNDLFTYLDHYLKENQVKLREVFDGFDRDRSGRLSARELGELVRALLPDPTDAELAYFQVMLDADGDGTITYDELLGSIKECWKHGRSVAGRASPEAADALSRVSAEVHRDRARARSTFENQDVTGAGALGPVELAAVLRALLPHLSRADLRYVISYLHFLDTAGDGRLTFPELLAALNALDVRLPGGVVVRGGSFPRPRVVRPAVTARPPITGVGAGRDAALRDQPMGFKGVQPEVREWVLREWTDPDSGKQLLLDEESQLVYMWDKTENWPALVGLRSPDDSLNRIETSATSAFFTALDTQLKVSQMTLADFLAAFDLQRGGYGGAGPGEDVALDRAEFGQLVTALLPSASVAQIAYLEAVCDLDGDQRVSASEILAAFKQLREMGPRVARHEDAAVVAALNKISDALARDQRGARAAFQRADQDNRGYLLPHEVARFFKALVPTLRLTDVRGLSTYLHLLDVNGNGQLEFKELLVALRAVPVRLGSRSYQRTPFRARGGVRTPTATKTVTGAGGIAVPISGSRGRLGDALRRQSRSGSFHVDSTDDEDIRPLHKAHGHGAHGEGSYYSHMELREFREGGSGSSGSQGGGYGSKLGSSMGGRHGSSMGGSSGQLLIDDETGLVYAREGAKRSLGGAGSAGGAGMAGSTSWPTLVGYVDPDTRTLVKVEPLARLTLFRDLAHLLGGSDDARVMLTDNFARVSKLSGGVGAAGTALGGSAGGAMRMSSTTNALGKDGAKLDVLSVVTLIDRMLPDHELRPRERGVLAAVLQVVGGDALGPGKLLKALDLAAHAAARLADMDEAMHVVLANVCASFVSGSKVFASEVRALQVPEMPGCLDPHGLMDLIVNLGGADPHLLESNEAKLAVVLWVLASAPPGPLDADGVVGARDVLKALHAVKCKLPGGGVLPPGFGKWHGGRGHAGRMSWGDGDGDDVNIASIRSRGRMQGMVDDYYDPRAMVQEALKAQSRSSAGGAGLAWQSPTRVSAADHNLSLERRGGAVPLSPTTGRPNWGIASMGRVANAQPRINPNRREVQLRAHKEGQGAGLQLPGTYLAVDPDTGLLYRCSNGSVGTTPTGSPPRTGSPGTVGQENGEGWPEVVGKVTAGGRTLPATTTGITKVFDSLRRIAGDEARMLQVFKAFDRDNSGTLELGEVMAMCRQLSGLTYNEACFVQAMLDADLNQKISFDEFLDGVRSTATALDDMTRTEREVMAVLHTASTAIASDLSVFWATYAAHDGDGNGHLDISEMSRFFRDMFKGVGVYELRLLVAYCFMMDVEKDGLVRPDELLQILHALPLRTPTGVTHKPGFVLPAKRVNPLLDSMGAGSRRQLAWQMQMGQGQQLGGSPLVRSSSNAVSMLGLGLPPGSVGWASQAPTVDPVTGQYIDPVTGQYVQAGGLLPNAVAGYPGTSPYATSYPYPPPPPAPPAPPPVAQPAAVSPSASQPYMIPGAPGQPPMVGYIIPYQQDLFQQLVEEAARVEGSRAASPSRRSTASYGARDDRVEVMDEFAAEPQGAVQGARPVQVRPGTASPQQYPPQQQGQYGQAAGGPLGYRSVSSPGYIQHYGQQGQYGQAVDPLTGAMGALGLQDGVPPLQQWRDQEREISELGFSPSQMAYRPGSAGGAPPAMWRTNVAQVPPGSMSVMSDGRPYGRATPFGLMQDLHNFLTTRREAFYNHFMMAAAPAAGGVRASQSYATPPGLVSKAAAAAVVQRAVPGASSEDVRYFQLMVDAVLPSHQALSLEDVEYAVRQAAVVERAVAGGKLHEGLRAVLRALGDAFYGAPTTRNRAAARFRELDWDRTGTLSAPEQVLLLQSLGAPGGGAVVGGLKTSDLMWATAALYWYNGVGGRSGYLTFEELGEALLSLSSLNPQAAAAMAAGRPGMGMGGMGYTGYGPGQQDMMGVRNSTGDLAMQMQQMRGMGQQQYGGQQYSNQQYGGQQYNNPQQQYMASTRGMGMGMGMGQQQPGVYGSQEGAGWRLGGSSGGAMGAGSSGSPQNRQYSGQQDGQYIYDPVMGPIHVGPQGVNAGQSAGFSFSSPFGSNLMNQNAQSNGMDGNSAGGGGFSAGGIKFGVSGGGGSPSGQGFNPNAMGQGFNPMMGGGMGMGMGGGGMGMGLNPAAMGFASKGGMGGYGMGGFDPSFAGGSMSGMGGMGMMGMGGGAANAYFAWTHDARQKVLEKWFAEDHSRKVRVMEEQKQKLESQVALKKATLDAQLEMRKVEQGLMSLAKAVEKDAYALTGQPPVQILTMDQLTARINGALSEAVNITRKKALLDDALQGNIGSYRPPPDFPSLMDALTSPDWLARMALPANLETLRLALQVRSTAADLERVRHLESHDMAWSLREAEAGNARLVHSMNVQAGALQAALQAQAAELGARLVADAQAAAGQAAYAAHQVSHAAADVAAATALQAQQAGALAVAAAAAHEVGAAGLQMQAHSAGGSSPRHPMVGADTAAMAAGLMRTQQLPGAPPSPFPQFFAAPPSPNQAGRTANSFLTSLFPQTPSSPLPPGAAGGGGAAGGAPSSGAGSEAGGNAGYSNNGHAVPSYPGSPAPAARNVGGYGSPPSPRGQRLSPTTWQMEPSADYVTVSGTLAAGFASVPGHAPVNVTPSRTSD